MIDRKRLVAALASRGVADWVIVQRDQQIGVVDEAVPRVHRVEQRTRWQLTVHDDAPGGRGSAHVAIDAVGGDPDDIVDQTLALARASRGPGWVTPPPAAPAKVRLDDPDLAEIDPASAAAEILNHLPRPAGVTVIAAARVLREHVAVIQRQGFRHEWFASHVQVDLLVSSGGRSLAIAREARRAKQLGLAEAAREAAADLELLATAGAATPGPYAVVLAADALLHDGLGVWAAFVPQADPVVERQGLTRYRERTPIAPGADQLAEPLSIVSDGALDSGVRSSPVGDEGEGVRRFKLVDRGIAAGLGLAPREAALRRREPNGGVRNLSVGTGTWPGQIETGARAIEIRRLRSLSIDPYTGDASLEIALGLLHADGGATPFAGGALRLDLIAALAHARRSVKPVARGPYSGPEAILIDRADLIA